MKYALEFFSKDIDPTMDGEYLIINPCDGFHLATAAFDEDGCFCGFYEFMRGRDDFYVAWAKLPESIDVVASQDLLV